MGLNTTLKGTRQRRYTTKLLLESGFVMSFYPMEAGDISVIFMKAYLQECLLNVAAHGSVAVLHGMNGSASEVRTESE